MSIQEKLYNILSETYDKLKENRENWEWWPQILINHDVGYHICESRGEVIDVLMDAINEGKSLIAVADPQCQENAFEGFDGCLLFPKELAEKIVILGHLPEFVNS
jgi:hypothetical protein